MATVKYQAFLPYDNTTKANYLSWAQGISNGMNAMGWTKLNDAGQVNWTTVASSGTIPAYTNSTYASHVASWSGAWTAGVSYPEYSVVTNGGLTFMAVAAASGYGLTTVVRNTAVTETITACTAAANGYSTYTMNTDAAGASNAYAGYIFVVTGMTVENNNGTFMCAGSTTTTLLLCNNSATVSSGQSGSAVSSASNTGFFGSALDSNFSNNALVGVSITTTGFAANSGQNNTTLVATSTGVNSSTQYTYFGGVFAGVSEVHSGVFTLSPNNDIYLAANQGQWTVYNYEVWVSTGPLSAAGYPIYLKLIYGGLSGGVGSPTYPLLMYQMGTNIGISGTITAQPTSNTFNGGTAYYMITVTPAQQGASVFECDFCGDGDSISMILWRGYSGSCQMFAIDRSRDAYGNKLSTYSIVMYCGCGQASSATSAGYQIIPPIGQAIFPASPVVLTSYGFPCIADANASSSYNGTAAAFLLFPMIGYMANPCLNVIAMKNADFVEGGVVNVTMYGTVHTYLMTKSFTYSSSLGPLGVASGVGIQWEVF